MIPTDLDVLARPVAHLPFVRAVVDQLGLLPAIEARCPKHALNRVSDADCVLALVLNVLCGRPALYRMDEWIGRLDHDVLFGEGTDPAAFNDTRLAEALDHLDEAGTDTVLADIVRAYLADEGEPRAFSAHHDTTSVSLYGAYEGESEPRPADGYLRLPRRDRARLTRNPGQLRVYYWRERLPTGPRRGRGGPAAGRTVGQTGRSRRRVPSPCRGTASGSRWSTRWPTTRSSRTGGTIYSLRWRSRRPRERPPRPA